MLLLAWNLLWFLFFVFLCISNDAGIFVSDSFSGGVLIFGRFVELFDDTAFVGAALINH